MSIPRQQGRHLNSQSKMIFISRIPRFSWLFITLNAKFYVVPLPERNPEAFRFPFSHIAIYTITSGILHDCSDIKYDFYIQSANLFPVQGFSIRYKLSV